MSRFKQTPKLPSQAENAFVAAAELPRTAPKSIPKPKKAKPTDVAVFSPVVVTEDEPWSAHDPASKTVASTQPLRLNHYQFEQLKWLAAQEDRSLSQILRRLLRPALDEATSSTKS